MYGFIILRHVNSFSSNCYWKESYNCIRRLYPSTQIVIIDDNSDPSHINNDDIELNNCIIINSEYPGRGELLPYYYYHKYKWFDRAIIIHDSAFLQKYIDFDKIEDKIKFLWHFVEHKYDNTEMEMKFIKKLSNNEELLDLYKDKTNWAGCFGVMSFIDYNALEEIQEKYNFLNLLEIVKTRDDRMCVERIFAVISYKLNDTLFHNPKPSLFGDIHRDYLSNWNFDYIKYLKIFYLSDTVCEPYNNYYAMKVWSGR